MEKRNITVAVSDSAYRSARHWAARHDTSISAIVEGCIERLPGLKVAQESVAEIKPEGVIARIAATCLPACWPCPVPPSAFSTKTPSSSSSFKTPPPNAVF